MEKCFLTNGGNLLRFHPTQKFYFQKPNGEFIREVSNSEAEFLCQNCMEMDVHFPTEHPEFLPTWNFIKSILILDDYSSFKPETSNNGGDYSFHLFHDWYVAKYPNGDWKFAFVERYTTSAEFPYDELDASFQSNLGCLNISNIMGEPVSYQCQQAKWWDGEEVHYYSEEVLEKIATMSCFENMWNEMYFYIPSKWDEDEYTDPAKQCVALSFTNKKEIVLLLKGLSMTKQDKKPSIRGQHRSGRR